MKVYAIYPYIYDYGGGSRRPVCVVVGDEKLANEVAHKLNSSSIDEAAQSGYTDHTRFLVDEYDPIEHLDQIDWKEIRHAY